jgi:hypothetical protein
MDILEFNQSNYFAIFSISYTNVTILKMHFDGRNFENDISKKIFEPIVM